jgi:7,8-dihydropterin-6-yl-methyl-4-(beta-D-ribofuranosyl)aminobenzene 5'-phosphate synthase
MKYRTAKYAFAIATCLFAVGCTDSRPTHESASSPEAVATAEEADLTWRRKHLPATDQPMVDDYKITILSDMIIGRHTVGEWGFSALVEVTSGGVSKRFLFDTGGNPQTVLTNAGILKIDVCSIQDVVLSHNHNDHTTGLDTLRKTCAVQNPDAFKNAYVGGDEIFWPRINAQGGNDNAMTGEKARFEAQGGTFVVSEQPTEAFLGVPGIWLTGKITRNHDEKTYPGTPNIQDPDGNLSPDLMPEEHALVINTAKGMVVLTGCAHAGIVNTIETAQGILGAEPPITLVGGIHLFPLPLGDRHTEGTVAWEARQLRRAGVWQILGAHCTGLERFVYIREHLRLDATSAAFSTIGTVLDLSTGFSYTNPALNTPLL